MTVTVLFILAGVWALVLVPPYVRNRHEGRPADSISSFRHNLSTLARTSPGLGVRRSAPMAAAPGVPVGRHEVQKRRCEVLFTLAGAAVITLFLALAVGGLAILFHLLADGLLGGYLYLLVQLRLAATGRDAKVTYLRPATRRPEPALVLRRSASN